jgi:hypothetical protein
MARRHQLSPSPSSTQPRTMKKPQPPGPQMTTNTTTRWSSLEQQDSSQLELTPLSWSSTPLASTSPCVTCGLSQRPFTVTIPGGRHSRMTEARQATQEAQMCQADPAHPSVGQDQGHPSSSPHVLLTCQTLKTPSSPLSHQLHHMHCCQLDSLQPSPLTYLPRALSLLPPSTHQLPQTMVAMLITPFRLITRLITTTVPMTATLKLQQGVIVMESVLPSSTMPPSDV